MAFSSSKGVYPFVRLTSEMSLWSLSCFSTATFKYIKRQREHGMDVKKSYSPGTMKYLLVYVLLRYVLIRIDAFLRWSPSVQRLVLKRMAAITIQSTKLLKWCTYMSKQHKLSFFRAVMAVFSLLWFTRVVSWKQIKRRKIVCLEISDCRVQ